MRVKIKTLLGAIGPLKTIKALLNGVEVLDLHSDENLYEAQQHVDHMIQDVTEYMQDRMDEQLLTAIAYKRDQLNSYE